jgi:hypothetical protein
MESDAQTMQHPILSDLHTESLSKAVQVGRPLRTIGQMQMP